MFNKIKITTRQNLTIVDFRIGRATGSRYRSRCVRTALCPNITGTVLDNFGGINAGASGAFYWDVHSAPIDAGKVGSYGALDLQASRYDRIYGNSSTVQMPALQILMIIKI